MSEYNMKSIKKKFKEKGIFYTPPELALMIKEYLPQKIEEVYDPTCGDGGLLKVFDNETIKYGQEIEERQCEIAREIPNSHIFCGDTLAEPAFRNKKFDYIVANPPFSIKWEPEKCEHFKSYPVIPTASRADYAFILHILDYLSDKGKAIVLNSPGILYRGNKEYKIRKWIIEQNYIEKIVLIPGKTFIDTTIATVILVLNKSKENNCIEFEDKELNKKRIVTIEEIEKNDYCLSVNNYIEKDYVKEIIDAEKLNSKARENMIKKIEDDINFDLMVCEIEGKDKKEYVNMIIDKLQEIKKRIEM